MNRFGWDYFDAIYCINLISRNDRYEEVKKIFDSEDINVEFFRAIKHPNDGLQGCFESHLSVINKAYDDGCDNVLIFEDDIVKTSNYSYHLLEDAINFMKSNDTWDIFFLGPFPEILKYRTERMNFIDYKNIYKIHSLCGHAYIVSRRFMKKFKDAKFTGIPLDYIYVANENSYAVYPGLFAQGSSASDNNGNVSFNFDQFPKAKQTFFRATEMYGYHVNMSLVWWIIFLLILWYAFIIWKPESRVLHIVFLIIIIALLFAIVK